MKAYTDIEQSKKLAEILPIESADMHYNNGSCRGIDYTELFSAELMPYQEALHLMKLHKTNFMFQVIPCWSLAALLEQLPYELCDDDGNSAYLQINKEDDVYQLVYTDPYGDFESIETIRYDDFVDACYEMIIKLKEQNLL